MNGSSAAVGPNLGAERCGLRVEAFDAGGRLDDYGSRLGLVLLRCESVSGSSSFLGRLCLPAASLHDSVTLRDSSKAASSSVFSSFSLSLEANKVSSCSTVKSSGAGGGLFV